MQVERERQRVGHRRRRRGAAGDASASTRIPDRTFAGAVVQVRNAPITVQNVVTYDVVVAVDNAELALRPGMTANVDDHDRRSRDDVLRVPTAALRFRPRGRGADGAVGAAAGARRRRAPRRAAAYARRGGGELERVALETGIARRALRRGRSTGELGEGDPVVVAYRTAGADGSDASPAQLALPAAAAGERRAAITPVQARGADRAARRSRRIYALGDDARSRALRGVDFAHRRAASSSRSWARRAPASRR